MRKKRIAIVNAGAHGHVNPTVAFTRKLVSAGHDVDYLIPRTFMPFAPAAGASLIPYETGQVENTPDPEGKARDIADATRGVPMRGLATDALARRDLVERGFELFSPVLEYCEKQKPDAIIYDRLCWSARLCADRFQIPSAMLHASYCGSGIAEGLHPVFDLPRTEEMGDLEGILARFSESNPTVAIDLDMAFEEHDTCNIVFMSKQFHPIGNEFDDSYHFVGAQSGAECYHSEKPPLVYISLGSVFGLNMGEFFRHCIRSFKGPEWRVVVSVGYFNAPEDFGPLPENVRVVQYADQLEALRKADAFVSHGGMNSVQEAIVSEVPMVVMPQLFDQITSAKRVAELGCGSVIAEDDLADLRAAVEKVSQDQGVVENLRRQKYYSNISGGANRAADIIMSLVS
jgi:MGT family glycosyltransferase